MKKDPKIAIVYDRVNKFGGAERVLQSLHALYPNAPLYTAVYDALGASWTGNWKVISSLLQRLPFAKNHHEIYAPLMPIAFEHFDFSSFDIVISVTSEAAKGIVTNPNTLHICYLLTPTRYLWSHEEEYTQGLMGIFLRIFGGYLKRWDRVASTRPDVMIPISKRVQERVNTYYNRVTDDVIYPPVDVDRFKGNIQLNRSDYPYILVVSRLVRYKSIDLAIEACKKEKYHLHIVGTGSDEGRLREVAGDSPYIHFFGHCREEEVTKHYMNCMMFLSLADEDFGIAAVEALAAGKPVVCYSSSGTAETIIEGETGLAFHHKSSEDVSRAIQRACAIQWDAQKIAQSARKFSQERFNTQFSRKVKELWKNF